MTLKVKLFSFCPSDVSQHTSEIMFEVYDRAQSNKFLGLAIVGMDELLLSPCQRQTIGLQSRPYEEDVVSGMLTLEVSLSSRLSFILMESLGYECLRKKTLKGGFL